MQVGTLSQGNAKDVHVGGAGLERGIVGVPNEFGVWTREAGKGSLSVAVEGPSKAIIDYNDRKDGSSTFSYKVSQKGEFHLSKFI